LFPPLPPPASRPVTEQLFASVLLVQGILFLKKNKKKFILLLTGVVMIAIYNILINQRRNKNE